MALFNYTFGDLIEQHFVRNSDGKYDENDAIGVNIEKEIRPMKGDTSRKELTTFYLVEPGTFVYNPVAVVNLVWDITTQPILILLPTTT